MNQKAERVFSRKCIVGLQSFLYDIIEIEDEIKDDLEITYKKVPIFYSYTGSRQYLKDLFLKEEKYCKELCGEKKLKGNKIILPSGILKMTGTNVITGELSNDNVRLKYTELLQTEFGKQLVDKNSRGAIFPTELSFEVVIRSNSELEILQIHDAVIEQLAFVRVFYISYKGFEKIPCMVEFPTGLSYEKKFSFGIDEENTKTLTLSLKMTAYRPVIDKSTEYNSGNTISDPKFNIIPKRDNEG
jgi:hypothetical protein